MQDAVLCCLSHEPMCQLFDVLGTACAEAGRETMEGRARGASDKLGLSSSGSKGLPRSCLNMVALGRPQIGR